MKIHRQAEANYVFFCPGCNCAHGFSAGVGAWMWNGDFDKPTISPSILALGTRRCHSFVRDGKIQFLGDCEHNLKNQTVELPEWVEGEQ